jgi:hypothetical protein
VLRLPAIEAARLFAVTHVRVTVAKPPDFAVYPDIAVRLRGALGNKLYRMGPPPSRWRNSKPRPKAWDALLEDAGYGVAKPLTVQAEHSTGTLTAVVRLAGVASYWQPDVLAAMVAAFDEGIALTGDTSHRVPLHVLAASAGIIGGFEPVGRHVGEVRMRFNSPLRLRSGHATRINAASLLIAMANRVRTLLPWQYLGLEEDWDRLHGAAWSIRADDQDLRPYRWDRGSRRSQGKVPVLGFLGTLAMTGALEPFMPYIQICQAMNAGSHAAVGLGHYEYSWLP